MAILLSGAAFGQQVTPHQQVLQLVEQHAAHFSATSRTIWEYAELGYQEKKSSALLQSELAAAGFRVQASVADEPTGFIASYGQGSPAVSPSSADSPNSSSK